MIPIHGLPSFIDPAALVDALYGADDSPTPAAKKDFLRGAVEMFLQAEYAPNSIDSIMASSRVDLSSMSVEDILFWLMITIGNAFNKHIQEQAAKVETQRDTLDQASGDQDTQKAQNSLDQEMQALQRLVTKRDQFMTMFQQLLKKYDESVAKVWQ